MYSYNSFPPQFAERSHHRHHGRHAFGGPRGAYADEFAAFGYADFPEPHMRGFQGGKPFGRHHGRHFDGFGRGGPHTFGGPQGPQGPGPYGPPPHAFGFGGPRGFHHHHRFPPPPGAEYDVSGYGRPRGFGRCGPPPPPFEYGARSFGCHGPPPPPFVYESGSSADENEKSEDEVVSAETCTKDAPAPFGFAFARGGRHGGHRHQKGFPGSGFETFGMKHHGRRDHRDAFPGDDGELRSFGFGGRHHGGRRGFGRFSRGMDEAGAEDFGFMHKKHRGPAQVESRVLKSEDMFQVQILRHGSPKGFKHYEITYETTDGEVVLSIDSEIDDIHKTYKFKEDEVIISDVTWDIIDRCLAVSVPKVQTTGEQAKVSEDVDMDNATLVEKPKGKKSKKSKKSKSKNISADDKAPSRPSSTDTWSSISTPSASEDEAEAETGNKVQIKAASKTLREEEPVRFRLPDLNNKSTYKEAESESETTESSSSEE